MLTLRSVSRAVRAQTTPQSSFITKCSSGHIRFSSKTSSTPTTRGRIELPVTRLPSCSPRRSSLKMLYRRLTDAVNQELPRARQTAPKTSVSLEVLPRCELPPGAMHLLSTPKKSVSIKRLAPVATHQDRQWRVPFFGKSSGQNASL